MLMAVAQQQAVPMAGAQLPPMQKAAAPQRLRRVAER
jgi:hypothetical protein